MSRHSTILALELALLLPSLAAAGASPAVQAEGPTLVPVTGSVGSGTLRPVVASSTPKFEQVDQATRLGLERVRRFLARDGKHPEGPPLRWIVPTGERTEPESAQTSPATGGAADAPGLLTLFSLTNPTSVVPLGYASTTNEPAAASKGNRIFYTMNWWAASSANGGASWAGLDPFSAPYAPVNDGFCCDQLALYDPRSDTLFFMQQYIDDGFAGTQRINIDRGFDGTWDCFYDFTPANLGQGNNRWFDYGDFALTKGHLFFSTNIFTSTTNQFQGGAVIKFPAASLSQCGAISYLYYTDPGFIAFRLVQGATDSMYFSSHISNNAIRIWRWIESQSTLTTFDRSVTAWTSGTRVCPGPDGRDWCGFIDSRMTAGFFSNGKVGFMWTAAQNATYSYPQVRVARFDSRNGMSVVDQPVIFNQTFAFAYPSAAVNDRGEIGGTLMFGGGATYYPSCMAWIADEQNAFVMAPLTNVPVVQGVIGPGENRSGDYLRTTAHWPNQSIFSGTCFAYAATDASASRHSFFGRSSLATALFRNGFETGDTGVWSRLVP